MSRTLYDRYQEAEILSADPVKLVRLLYRGAAESVRAARRYVEQGDIRGRSREINRAWSILQELAGSLDHVRGGEISRGLVGLYAYMQARLIEANVTQSCAPLEEVEALLIPLLEAWQGAQAAHQSDGEPNGEVEGEAAYALG